MENWYSDNGDGTYTNPVLYTDYSDPDAIRVGDDYYMVASSFCNTPGLPILHSKDMVNWTLINYALENIPYERYKKPMHGCGVWAPAIRYFGEEFVIFFPMPDEGIFVTKAKDPADEWSEPVAVFEGKGWIDPCPFIDDDGKAYMVNAFARSRIGFKSVLQIVPLSSDLTKMAGEPVRVFDGNTTGQDTIEGPKLYKRNGWYYIFAPAGGVKQGWQTVLRSKNIYGPYEFRNVMEQKDTDINGPHQGAWVDTPDGSDYFIHFQDVYAAGRIIHVQPMRWENDWPIIGEAMPGEICGKPVTTDVKPVQTAENIEIFAPDTSDEFEENYYGLQWQWNANHEDDWAVPDESTSSVILKSVPAADSISDQPNLFLQKWPMPEFSAVTSLSLKDLQDGDEAGIVNMGVAYAALSVLYEGGKYVLRSISGEQKFSGEVASATDEIKVVNSDFSFENDNKEIFFKYTVTRVMPTETNTDGKFEFPIPREIVALSYSLDGHNFKPAHTLYAQAGRWVGVKCGIYVRNMLGKEGGCLRSNYFVFE
ncbi:MAG: glycoside hydrolase 43 family protein [Lachnospiraceae bacterium]|nr:glycoside hydrolase 43 family protein [Lachnospiraceae bacterium]